MLKAITSFLFFFKRVPLIGGVRLVPTLVNAASTVFVILLMVVVSAKVDMKELIVHKNVHPTITELVAQKNVVVKTVENVTMYQVLAFVLLAGWDLCK